MFLRRQLITPIEHWSNSWRYGFLDPRMTHLQKLPGAGALNATLRVLALIPDLSRNLRTKALALLAVM